MLKKIILLVLISFNAWSLSFDEAKHLLLRTGFDVQQKDIEKLLPLNREQAFYFITSFHNQYKELPPPSWLKDYREVALNIRKVNRGSLSQSTKKEIIQKVKSFYSQIEQYLPNEKKFDFSLKNKKKLVRNLRKLNRQSRFALQVDWFEKILSTKSPITEKMTIFWHNHFVSSFKKVKRAHWMYDQVALLRKHSLGNFGELLEEVTVNPAMLRYLDGVQNHNDSPNENYAREVMELFTLGEGNYTEKDIKEVARALTGLKINHAFDTFRFAKRKHDFGEKVILGKKGNFGYADVVKILLDQDQTAVLVMNKLWKEFISFKPNKGVVKSWAKQFKESNYNIYKALKLVLTSKEFYDPKVRGALIKSPIELTLGSLRQFGFILSDWTPLVRINNKLGQALYNPPTVKGWAGGKKWITTSTLLERQHFIRKFISYQQKGMGMMSSKGEIVDIDKWFKNLKGKDKMMSARKILLALDDNEKLKFRKNNIRNLKDILLKPHYQLK